MTQASFTVVYDGPALEVNQMQVRDLAPALLAFGDAINVAARIHAPTGPLPGLAISATQPGSFRVVLEVTDPPLMHKIQDFLIGDGTAATLNAAALIALLSSAFGGVRWMWRRRIRSVDELPQAGWVRLTDHEGNTFDMPTEALAIAQDLEFRIAANQIVEPLADETVESVEIIPPEESADSPAVKITYAEKGAFAVPELPEELITENTAETLVRLVNIAFRDGHKWKVSDGEIAFWVEIHDHDFLSRVQRAEEQFSAGDVLRVSMRTRQWSTMSGPRTERAVLKVIDHRSGPRQVPLPFGDIGEI